jgi:hypothetical protein
LQVPALRRAPSGRFDCYGRDNQPPKRKSRPGKQTRQQDKSRDPKFSDAVAINT